MVAKRPTDLYSDLFPRVCRLFEVKSLGGIFMSQCRNTQPSAGFYAALLLHEHSHHPLVRQLILAALMRFSAGDLLDFCHRNPDTAIGDLPYDILHEDEEIQGIVAREQKRIALKAQIEALDSGEDIPLNPVAFTPPPFPGAAGHE